MSKIEKKASTALAPVPVVMVSCVAPGYQPNIITLAWVGHICSDPPMLSISIRPERHSYGMIKESKEFVVNVPNQQLLKITDYCGVVSGREVNKFTAAGLTAVPGRLVKAPLIEEAPLNLECRVKEIVKLGTHDLFLAEILLVHVNEECIDSKGMLSLERMNTVAYGNGGYYQVGEFLGTYGYSRGSL